MDIFKKFDIDLLFPEGINESTLTTEAVNKTIASSNGKFNGFSFNILNCLNVVRTKSQISTKAKTMLRTCYTMITGLPMHASQEVFDAIPKFELECWFDHANDVLLDLYKNHRWKKSGTLEEHDFAMLSANVYFLMHYKSLQVALEKDFFENLAKFIASREPPKVPCAEIAKATILIIHNASIMNRKNCEGKNNTAGEGEKFWKKLEASGLLLQFIRCSTIPQDRDFDAYKYCYNELLKCLKLIKSKFKKGQPCGDVIHAILSGNDGSDKPNPIVMTYLNNIVKILDVAQDRASDKRICSYCSKGDLSAAFQQSLMQCSRCKSVFYCSKECQVNDWKTHKQFCKKMVRSDECASKKSSKAMSSCYLTVVNEHYVYIMQRLLDEMEETGLTKEELVLFLDFNPDEDGRIPALCNPPKCEIKSIYEFIKRCKPQGPNMDPIYNPEVETALKLQQSKMTKNHLLCLVDKFEGSSVCKIALLSNGSQQHMFSPAAIEAYRNAMYNFEFDEASKIFDDEVIRMMKRLVLAALPDEMRAEIDPLGHFLSNFMKKFDEGGEVLSDFMADLDLDECSDDDKED